jgi:hypothetical protein
MGSFFMRAYYSYHSPKKRERCCIAMPNFIATISSIYLYSTLSKSPIKSISPISVASPNLSGLCDCEHSETGSKGEVR